jgi:hypothetical protein
MTIGSFIGRSFHDLTTTFVGCTARAGEALPIISPALRFSFQVDFFTDFEKIKKALHYKASNCSAEGTIMELVQKYSVNNQPVESMYLAHDIDSPIFSALLVK